jgi:hypothetical protein
VAIPETMGDERTTVLALLEMAGLSPTEGEIDAMAADYPARRQMVASLYAMRGTRYEEPALVFDPRIEVS